MGTTWSWEAGVRVRKAGTEKTPIIRTGTADRAMATMADREDEGREVKDGPVKRNMVIEAAGRTSAAGIVKGLPLRSLSLAT